MPSFSPLPQIVEDACVNIAEGLLGARMAVIVGPAPDCGVEHSQHVRCGATEMGFDYLFCF